MSGFASARTRSSRTLRLATAVAALFCVLGLARSTPVADAGMVSFPVDFFMPFTDTGTIVVYPPIDDDPNGPGCHFFLGDHGGLYFFNGIDAYEEGDRLLVMGQICLVCLTYNVCQIPAAPIVKETVIPIVPVPNISQAQNRGVAPLSAAVF